MSRVIKNYIFLLVVFLSLLTIFSSAEYIDNYDNDDNSSLMSNSDSFDDVPLSLIESTSEQYNIDEDNK